LRHSPKRHSTVRVPFRKEEFMIFNEETSSIILGAAKEEAVLEKESFRGGHKNAQR